MQNVNQPMADSGIPKTMTANMPSMALTVEAVTPGPVQPTGLTPHSLLERLPSIIQPAPVNVEPCNTFASWIADNGLLVGIGMAALAWFAWSEGKR